MSVPCFELFKYRFRYYILKKALPSYGVVQIGRNGTGKEVPAEVIGGRMSLHGSGKVEEGGRGVVEWIDVYGNVEAARGVRIDPG